MYDQRPPGGVARGHTDPQTFWGPGAHRNVLAPDQPMSSFQNAVRVPPTQDANNFGTQDAAIWNTQPVGSLMQYPDQLQAQGAHEIKQHMSLPPDMYTQTLNGTVPELPSAPPAMTYPSWNPFPPHPSAPTDSKQVVTGSNNGQYGEWYPVDPLQYSHIKQQQSIFPANQEDQMHPPGGSHSSG